MKQDKIFVRFVGGNPGAWEYDTAQDILIDDIVIYPRIIIKGSMYNVVGAVSVSGREESDRMILVSRDFGPMNAEPLKVL